MPSPFPGMDPYLEDPAHWSDFHARFINYWAEELERLLPDHYSACIGERIYLIEEPPHQRRLIVPDVALERQPGPASPRDHSGGVATATATLTGCVTLPLPAVEPQPRETYIEILHRDDHSLVTALELLSPSNKEQPGREQYLAKRNALIVRDVNLVELDLLLGGQRLPMRVELPAGDYYAFVARGDQRPDCDVYPWMMPEPLPTLPIPLRAPEPDVLLDLGALFALVYDRRGFARRIDYARLPPVRVSDERLKWIDSLLQSTRSNGSAKA